MDRLDKVMKYLHSNTAQGRTDGDQLIQLACNCIKYADFYTIYDMSKAVSKEMEIKNM